MIYQQVLTMIRFVVYVNGDKQITDVRTNDGLWHHVCVTWTSAEGAWAIYLDGILRDHGTGLANGTSIQGEAEKKIKKVRVKIKHSMQRNKS